MKIKRLRPLADCLKEAMRLERQLTFAALLLGCVVALLPTVSLALLAFTIGILPKAVSEKYNASVANEFFTLGSLWVLALCLQNILPRALQAVATCLRERIDQAHQHEIMILSGRVLRIDEIEHQSTRDLIDAASAQGVGQFTTGAALLQIFGTRLPRTLGGGIAASLLFFYSWWMSIILSLCFTLASLANNKIQSAQANIFLQTNKFASKGEYFRGIAMDPINLKEIKIFQIADWLSKKMSTFAKKGLEDGVSITQRASIFAFFATVIFTASFLLVSVSLAKDAVAGRIGIPLFLIFFRSAASYLMLGQQGAGDYVIWRGANALSALQKFRRRFEQQPDDDDTKVLFQKSGDIVLKKVFFAFSEEKEVLRDISFRLPAGGSLAIVGLNGAGKSTLAKLLCGLYLPTSGVITSGGIALDSSNQKGWQRRVSAVFQEFARFDLTVAQNIGMGTPDEEPSEAELEGLGRETGLSDRVKQLPLAWNTLLSSSGSEGPGLSGGEWQRVSLARALLAVKRGSRLVVLDEPTSHLDVEGEAYFYQEFLRLTKGITSVLISHRFSTVRNADSICVLDNGRIIEFGAHDELMVKQGKYAELFNLQSKHFVK